MGEIIDAVRIFEPIRPSLSQPSHPVTEPETVISCLWVAVIDK